MDAKVCKQQGGTWDTNRKKCIIKDMVLLKEATDALLSVDCQFSACEGFDKKPIDMITCRRCWALYDIGQKYPKWIK